MLLLKEVLHKVVALDFHFGNWGLPSDVADVEIAAEPVESKVVADDPAKHLLDELVALDFDFENWQQPWNVPSSKTAADPMQDEVTNATNTTTTTAAQQTSPQSNMHPVLDDASISVITGQTFLPWRSFKLRGLVLS